MEPRCEEERGAGGGRCLVVVEQVYETDTGDVSPEVLEKNREKAPGNVDSVGSTRDILGERKVRECAGHDRGTHMVGRERLKE